MATLTSLLDRHKADLAAEFKTAFTALEAKIDLIQTTVSSHGQRIASLETNADSVDGRLLGLEATCAELTAANEKLKAKTADLEARSRRNNVRIIGLPESIEGPRPTDFFSALLSQLLGEETLPKPPVLDRAHRSLAPKPKQGERPRPVIIRFHDYQTKERVLREARKRRSDLRYLESPVAIFEDFSPEVMAQRAAYREVMALLYKRGLKPSLRYPAKLYITTNNGERILLSSAVKAKEYLSSDNT
ncbi:hypothetical protein D4764_06G0014140 [Takifugu flavidus]|uniref:LINE-1 type transposase domain-containing protein 1 ES cell-associated protein 11 n=1 Tax=Takifugu flavidus TaxID=433684 RepID=A0A5C6MX44_9TELE|nr:hypothetical protein D4764_06G0014140 [Takifugu flavidus]